MGVIRGMALGKFIYYSVGLANVVVLQPGLVDLGVPRDQSSESRLEGGREEDEDEGNDRDDQDDGYLRYVM